MKNYRFILVIVSIFLSVYVKSQDSFVASQNLYINGFIRAGLYGSIDRDDDKPYISSAFSDFSLQLEMSNNVNYKAYADMRFRYGQEFMDPVNSIMLREAYVRVNGSKWDITAGQAIIKWGRANFTNPVSKLNPQNFISRSPDQEDMDMGNLLISTRWYPVSSVKIEAVAVPFYRSSVLLIDPVKLPDYVNISQIKNIITDKSMFSYGLKADFYTGSAAMSVSWFDGYDPMPGAALTHFDINMTDPVPVPDISITMTPYKIRNLGFDFEAVIGRVGFRGEAAWMFPQESCDILEYVPCEEIEWAAGLDWTSGDWRFIIEYTGKAMPHFTPLMAEPLIGTEFDLAQMGELLADPDFDMHQYVKQQVGAFNRLYNYQLERYYHSVGFRTEADLLYGKLSPSLFTLYNFTARDFLIIPEIRYKPSDGLTLSAGGEFYKGRKGSVYDIVNEFMNCVRLAVRVDF